MELRAYRVEVFDHRRRRVLYRRLFGLLSIVALPTCGASLVSPELPVLGPLVLVMLLGLCGLQYVFAGSQRGKATQTEEGVDVTVDPAYLTIGRIERFRRAAIVAGWIDDADHLVLRLRDRRDIVIDTGDVHPERLLKTLELGPDQCAVQLPIGSTAEAKGIADFVESGMYATFVPGLALAMVAGAFAASIASDVGDVTPTALMAVVGLLCLTSVAGILLAGMARRRRAIIGNDGLHIHGRGSRFIPYSDVDEVSGEGSRTIEDASRVIETDQHVVLTLRDGERVVLPVDPLGAGLRQRIEQAMASQVGEAPLRIELLDRDDREITAWRTHLRGIVGHQTAYRAMGLAPEQLEGVLSDPAVHPLRRIGAALALVATERPDASERIRVAADATAQPALRQALRIAAAPAPNDDLLERALEEFEELALVPETDG